MLRDERAIRRLERRWQRDAVLNQLWDLGPAAVFGGLLHYAKTRNYNLGWAAHSFREIFGTWPRPQDRVEPKALPDHLVEKWAAGRKRSPKRAA